MGSLKDETKGLTEDHKTCEKEDDGERPGGLDGSAEPEGDQTNTSQESTSPGDCEPERHMNASYAEQTDLIPKDQELSGEVCDNRSGSIGAIPLTQQPAADRIHNGTTISNKFLSDEDEDKNMDHGREKGAEIENISMAVPATPGPLDPRSPAPAGQHHMRTQVSLEVVQCHSAATSPMTPPEGTNSFFFPSSFGKTGAGVGVGTDTKDAELQVGHQVEFCSVATSPMTPKTPSSTAFPELIGRETVKKSRGQTQSPAESERVATSKELGEDFSSKATPESPTSCPPAGLMDAHVTVEDGDQQCKQQRMGSMDQDITIMVTHYDNNEGEEETGMVKIDEYKEPGESSGDAKTEDGSENTSTETQDSSNTNPPPDQTEDASEAKAEVERGKAEGLKNVCVTKPAVPESPAPFGCHNVRTQVSLEVVQCQSAATSPMTPPEGDQAFCFPSSLGRCAALTAETKDAEMQVGQQVEYRSVATAPMTPRTPTITTFPEIRKGASVEEKIVEEEEEEDKNEQGVEEEKVADENTVAAAEEGRDCKEKCEEPVQEVSWDEKGMTWEVYGAVVEVTVLGSAIQKHLEKQVKKRQPSMPPPPPLNPSAVPLSPESEQGGSGKGRAGKRGDGEVSRRRRNPFRQMMENMQQPHCCSKAHTTE